MINPLHIKLFLALLWLIPGLGFLAWDAVSGQAHTLTMGGLRLPFAWLFLLFAAFNLLRWWMSRPASIGRSPLDDRRLRRRNRPGNSEPDSPFRFDDPPKPGTVNEDR